MLHQEVPNVSLKFVDLSGSEIDCSECQDPALTVRERMRMDRVVLYRYLFLGGAPAIDPASIHTSIRTSMHTSMHTSIHRRGVRHRRRVSRLPPCRRMGCEQKV